MKTASLFTSRVAFARSAGSSLLAPTVTGAGRARQTKTGTQLLPDSLCLRPARREEHHLAVHSTACSSINERSSGIEVRLYAARGGTLLNGRGRDAHH